MKRRPYNPPSSLRALLWTQLSHQRAAFEVGYVALAVP
jgi:hypothetical protein